MDVGQAWVALCHQSGLGVYTQTGWYCAMRMDRLVECSAPDGTETKTFNHSQFLAAFKDAIFTKEQTQDIAR